jgi:Ca2+-binding RTX toxin-like protein
VATITGSNAVDRLLGTGEDDQISALNSNDTIIGSEGSDRIDGGTETDTIDYSSLDRDLTLTPGGGVTKSGGGQDSLIGIETIIGNPNRNNRVDAGGANASMDVDLVTETMRVTIPGGRVLNFRVQNFNDVVGTNNNSRMVGNSRSNRIIGGSGDDVMIGSSGNDTMDGGGGNNTMDYGSLGAAVKILPRGRINKGSLGTDQVSNFQTIIGASGRANTIDASTADGGASLNLDLSANSMRVNIPGNGGQEFSVVNFIHATGSNNNDTIVGSNSRGKLKGNGGNDTIRGGSNNDLITGTDRQSRGVGEIDNLTGGGGRDVFILGDRNGAYYTGNGRSDYAIITDFNPFQDAIDVGRLRNYSFGMDASGAIELFSGRNINNRDLIAKVQLSGGFGGESRSSANPSSAMAFGGAMMGLSSPVGGPQLNVISGNNAEDLG